MYDLYVLGLQNKTKTNNNIELDDAELSLRISRNIPATGKHPNNDHKASSVKQHLKDEMLFPQYDLRVSWLTLGENEVRKP